MALWRKGKSDQQAAQRDAAARWDAFRAHMNEPEPPGPGAGDAGAPEQPGAATGRPPAIQQPYGGYVERPPYQQPSGAGPHYPQPRAEGPPHPQPGVERPPYPQPGGYDQRPPFPPAGDFRPGQLYPAPDAPAGGPPPYGGPQIPSWPQYQPPPDPERPSEEQPASPAAADTPAADADAAGDEPAPSHDAAGPQPGMWPQPPTGGPSGQPVALRSWQQPAPGGQRGAAPPIGAPYGPPPVRRPGSPELATEALLRARRNLGLRRSGKSGSSMKLNDEQRRMVDQVRMPPIWGCHRIAVISLKGGVGKTITTVCLGATLASLRGDRVIAVDANPDRGTLSGKITLQTESTVRDLLDGVGAIDNYSDVRRFTSQSADRLEVLASDADPAVSSAFSEQDYRTVNGVLERYYNLVLTDCGTGLLHSAMAGVLALADQLVVVSSPSVDGARSASATLDWLEAHGYSRLVRDAVAVINSVRTKTGVNVAALDKHFGARCRAVVQIPYDEHLELGAEVDLAELGKDTRVALLQLACRVAEGFGHTGPGYGQPGQPGYVQSGRPGYPQGQPGYGQPGPSGHGQPGQQAYAPSGQPGYGRDPGSQPGYGSGFPEHTGEQHRYPPAAQPDPRVAVQPDQDGSAQPAYSPPVEPEHDGSPAPAGAAPETSDGRHGAES